MTEPHPYSDPLADWEPSEIEFAIGDTVYDVEVMQFGQVLAIHGKWAWLKLEDSTAERPVTSPVLHLIRVIPDEKEKDAA